MHTIRIRFRGEKTRAESLMNMLHEMEGVEYVEELSLRAGGHPRRVRRNRDEADARTSVSLLKVGVSDDADAHRIRMFTAGAAILMDASAEFVDRF